MADAVTPAPERPRRGWHLVAYGGRFGVAYALLALVLGGAAAGLALLLTRPSPEPAPPWSEWQPITSGLEPERQIANYVARRYRLPSGRQLVGVLVGPPSVQDIPLAAIAVQPTVDGAPSADELSIVSTEESVLFILCGLGDRCSIAAGTPSPKRERLLRREALELALYTFRYVEEVESVLAFLPPPPGEDPAWTMFFRRSDLRNQLERPLKMTLPLRSLNEPGDIGKVEALTIDRLTEPRRFRFQFQQLQDGRAILVLAPSALGG